MREPAFSSWGPIPTAKLEFLEYMLGGGAAANPSATCWVEDGQVVFAALDFIEQTPWLIRGELARSELTGLLRLTRLTIESWYGGAEVTGTLLRKIRFAEIRDEATSQLVYFGDRATIHFGSEGKPFRLFSDEEEPIRRRAIQALRKDRRKRGPKGYPPNHWREVARAVVEISNDPKCRNLYGPLCERYDIPRGTARDWVRKVTKMNLLMPGQPGRVGRQPGPLLGSQPSGVPGD
jgi:hypothetical protein